MNDIQLKFLRGPHSVDVVAEIANLAHDCDAVYIEFICPISFANTWHPILNNLSSNSEYIKGFEDNLDEYLNNNFPARIAWALRGQHKLFGFIDTKLNDDRAAEEMEFLSISYGTDDMLRKCFANPSQRHDYIRSFIDNRAVVLSKRDSIVVGQITGIVENALAAGKPYKAAIVQGYVHNVVPKISGLYPEIKIEDVLYGQNDLELVNMNPLLKLLEKQLKLENISNKELDYFMYYTLMYIKHTLKHPESKQASIERQLDIMNTGMGHSSITITSQVIKSIGSINHLDEKILSASVVEMLNPNYNPNK